MRVVADYMQTAYDHDVYPEHFICHGKSGSDVDIECEATGKRSTVLSFSSNDILGLAQSPAVRQAAIDAILQYGPTNSSCATLAGRIATHRDLEREISAFKGLPHTYLFLNAWMAMQAVFDAFCHLAMALPGFRNTRETVIFTDSLNHGCITTAVSHAGNRSGKAFSHSPDVRVKPLRHVDMEDLARKLRRYVTSDERVVVVSDAVFSMDGDIAPLPELVDILGDYPGSVLLLDEAHSSGALGTSGHGIFEHFQMTPSDVLARGVEPVVMTTFSKFAASAGAAISTFSEEFTRLLDVSPTSIGTISPPPPTTAAALQAIRELRADPALPKALRENTAYLRAALSREGFTVLGETNVIPVLLDAEVAPKAFARELMDTHGIWVSPIWFIARPRLRIVVTALHTRGEMDRLVRGLVETRHHFQPALLPS